MVTEVQTAQGQLPSEAILIDVIIGGVTAGSEAFGLGGGYKITPDTMEIGNGIGINGKYNETANVLFKGSTNGTFELKFESTANFACVPSNNGTVYSVVCTTVTASASYLDVDVEVSV